MSYLCIFLSWHISKILNHRKNVKVPEVWPNIRRYKYIKYIIANKYNYTKISKNCPSIWALEHCTEYR